MIRKQTIEKFLEGVSSRAPTPGGGAVAALAGAIGAGLVSKVARLSLGQREEEFRKLGNKVTKLQSELLKLADEDCQAYNKVVEAYRLPKGSEGQNETRKTEIQEALKQAALVPLKTAKKSLDVLNLASFAARNGNQNCVSDARCAVELATAAIYGALENVRINLSLIKDQNFVKNLKEEIGEILDGETLRSD